MFLTGDTVVYPHHGAGRVLDIQQQVFRGEPRSYYVIQILHSDMTVKVPVDGVERAGIRPVISEARVDEVMGVLRDDPTRMPCNWNRRVKHNREKIKTGDVLELADVVRNLALRDHERGLSTGEKQMFNRARRILASELMYAKDLAADDAIRLLDGVLDEVCSQQTPEGEDPWFLP
jgi:CarD family transcriptional regulator